MSCFITEKVACKYRCLSSLAAGGKKNCRGVQGDDPGGGAFGLFLRSHPGEFAHFFKEMLMPGISPGGGGDGHCWNLLMHNVCAYPSH